MLPSSSTTSNRGVEQVILDLEKHQTSHLVPGFLPEFRKLSIASETTKEDIVMSTSQNRSLLESEPAEYQVQTNPEPDRHIPIYPRSMILPNGTIQIELKHKMRVDLTIDCGARIFNKRSRMAISVSADGSSTAYMHPNGQLHQKDKIAELTNYFNAGDTHHSRFSKITETGVTFRTSCSAFTYLVQATGTITTHDDCTLNMFTDYIRSVFYSKSHFGPNHIPSATAIIQRSGYRREDDADIIFINGMRVIQRADGFVHIDRDNGCFAISTHPIQPTASIVTPHIYCTASLKDPAHIYVKMSDKSIYFNGISISARCSGRNAGFQEDKFFSV